MSPPSLEDEISSFIVFQDLLFSKYFVKHGVQDSANFRIPMSVDVCSAVKI